MSNEAAETPLVDLLLAIPEQARYVHEHSPTHHSFHPVGLHCHRAAARIAELEKALREAHTVLGFGIYPPNAVKRVEACIDTAMALLAKGEKL